MKKKDLAFWLTVAAIIVVAITIIFSSGSTFAPLIIAFVIAYLLDPLVAWFEKKKVNRGLAILIVFVAFTIFIVVLGGWFIGSIIGEFQGIQINLTEYASRAYDLIPARIKEYLDIESPEKVYDRVNKGIEQLRGASYDIISQAFGVLKKAFTSTLGFLLALFSYVILPIYVFYILKDLPTFKKGTFDLIPLRYRDQVNRKLHEVDEIISSFVRGQLSVCALLAILYSVGLYFIGIDLAIVIGTFAGFAFIIPYLGTVIGIVLSVIMALLKFHDVLHPLLCVGWIAAVQVLESYFLTPRLVGHKVGLHPVMTILAVILFGQYFGIVGMLVAVPVTAILKVFLRSLIDYYRKTPYYSGT